MPSCIFHRRKYDWEADHELYNHFYIVGITFVIVFRKSTVCQSGPSNIGQVCQCKADTK